MTLTQVAKRHRISRASVCRLMKEFNNRSPSAPAVASGDHLVAQVVLGDYSL
jgi:hypothetical protein